MFTGQDEIEALKAAMAKLRDDHATAMRQAEERFKDAAANDHASHCQARTRIVEHCHCVCHDCQH